jgi:serine-type D-Ala-D-Ala carboxypeptidase/endopeptidase
VPSRDGRQITLEQLSTHRSGLPRLPDNLAPAAPADPYADYDAPRLYAFLANHRLRRAPGDSAEYSNLGGGLLGHALTLRARAPSWGALVEQRITGPLGMRETFVNAPPALRARVSAGHDASMDTVPAWHLDALAGAGALRSTASDMLTYLAAMLDTTQGPLARAAALVQKPRADFAAGMRIGLGWLQMAAGPRAIWWHNGGTGGFRTIAAFDPARRVAVVVLSNSSVSVDDIGLHLLDGTRPVGLPIRAPRTQVTLSAEQLDRVTGAYELSPGFVLTIARNGDALTAQATGQPRLPMVAVSPFQFVIPVANAELIFDISEAGPAKHVTLRQNGAMVTGVRKP